MKRVNHLVGTFLCAATLGVWQASAAECLELVSQNKTDYTIIAPEKPSEDEKAAVKDLQTFLKQITCVEFSVGAKDAPAKIYVGKIPDNDKRPFRTRERRIRSVGKDIYIYGEGPRESAFAVYDFLEKQFGCKWFTAWGDMKIPKNPNPRLSAIDWCLVPSFETFEVAPRDILMLFGKNMIDFRRRNRMHFGPRARLRPGTGWKYIGFPVHAMSSIIPPGDRGVDCMNLWAGAHPAVADKKYFQTNPEFFTLNKDGKRVGNKLLCFSNKELRKEFTKNLEKIIAYEKYDGKVPAVISLDVNDNGGPFCCCPGCEKQIKKYGAPGGAYYDYLLEISPYFKQKYPKLVLRFLAYGSNMTEIPPVNVKFPDNLVPMPALIEGDFLQPFTHPGNAQSYRNLRNWSKVTEKMWLWLYSNPYNRPRQSFPLIAGLERIAADLRTAHQLKCRMIFAEYGGGVADCMGFKDLWIYATARLADNVNADTKEIIREFFDAYYGSASGMMQEYYYELEDAAKKETRPVSWWADPCLMTYVNPENLVRWQGMFEKMEQLTSEEPAANLHVKRARMNLDQATVAIWNKIRKQNPGWATDKMLNWISVRHDRNLRTSIQDMFKNASLPPHLKKAPENRRNLITWGGFQLWLAEAKGPKRPLPADFLEKYKGRKITQIAPCINKWYPNHHDDAAFGVAIEAGVTNSKLCVQNYINLKRIITDLPNAVLSSSVIRKEEPGYHLYHVGNAWIAPDCQFTIWSYHGLSINYIGQVYDESKPDGCHDIFLSLKYKGKGRILCDRIVIVSE